MTRPSMNVIMDEEAILEAELQQELELIDLDSEDDVDDEPINYDENFELGEVADDDGDDVPLSKDLQLYLDMVQQQSNKLEEELKACDEELYHTNRSEIRLAPVLEDGFIVEEAKSRGMDPAELQKQILADIEKLEASPTEDEEEEEDETENDDDGKAVVPYTDQMKMKKEILAQIKALEEEHKEQKKRWLEENEKRKEEEEMKVRLKEDERHALRKDLENQEQELHLLKTTIENKLEEEHRQQQRDYEEKKLLFEEKMAAVTKQLEEEKSQLLKDLEEEQTKSEHKKTKSVVTIQRCYRGYRVRKEYGEPLKTKLSERKEKRLEERIKQVEERMKEEKKLEEEEKRKQEEALREKQRQDEEMKRMEAERQAEIKRREEERKKEAEQKERDRLEKLEREKEEEERWREEERLREEKRKEEEKLREEKRKEEERLQEEKRREEERLKEEKRKEEERLKEEKRREEERLREEKRKEEERLKEEKRKEEERLKEEKKREEERLKEEKKRREEERMKEENKRKEERRLMEEKKRKEEEERKKEELKGPSEESIYNELESRRLAWIKDCVPWSKISNEPWKLKPSSGKKPPRPPPSAKKLPPLDEKLILASAQTKSLKQVTTVELLNLPGCSMSTLTSCWALQCLTLTSCNLVAVDGLSQCKQLQYLNVQDNNIEYVDVKDLGKLQVVNLSRNKLSVIHGLDGCMNIRHLDLSCNKITRLGGLAPLRRLHTLLVNNNQLIDTAGLSDICTLQILDLSNNHLQSVSHLNSHCLLQRLLAACNNLLQVPDLSNCVLLNELDLSNNSITSLLPLSSYWLPVLQTLKLDQNSIVELPVLRNLLLLKTVNLSQNEIEDSECIRKSLSHCPQLKALSVEGNPAFDDGENRQKIMEWFPRLVKLDKEDVRPKGNSYYVCKNDSERFYCHQVSTYQMMFDKFLKDVKNIKTSTPINHTRLGCVYFTFCDQSAKLAEEFRYSHEYGDMSIQSFSPVTTGSSPLKSSVSDPKEMFEKALNSSDSSTVTPSAHSAKTSNDKTVGTSTYVTTSSNPKDLFEKALNQHSQVKNNPKELFEKSLNQASLSSTNPKDLFEKAVNNASSTTESNPKNSFNSVVPKPGVSVSQSFQEKDTSRHLRTSLASSVTSQSAEFQEIWVAAIIIQAAWRGYLVRRGVNLKPGDRNNRRLHQAATRIQAIWRGYYLRCKLQMAMEYAQLEEKDDLDLPDIDMNEFTFDENNLEMDWRPSDTPQFPQGYHVLGKPPSGRTSLPPVHVPALDIHKSPPQVKHAWRNMDSPLSDIKGRQPRPPSSLNSTVISTHRTGLSKKSEQLSEEWGFKDTRTADLMLQRAKKMKYNAQRKKKLGKLDPKQRLAMFRKLEENTLLNPVIQPPRKVLPRKEYFQAREEEMVKQAREKRVEYGNKVSRTYEWLHTQVGEHDLSSPTPRQHHNQGLKSTGHYGSTNSLSRYQGRSPVTDLESIHSLQSRRHSVSDQSSYWGKPSVLPPIKTLSAPSSKVKEKMSWRNPDVDKSVGWGGGKKRSGKK